MTPGSGLCAGFTTTRAILSDALALVRGDRFYTVDYTPHHLTPFGFTEASSDNSIAGGGVMYKLLMRAFRKSCRFCYSLVSALMFPSWIVPRQLDIRLLPLHNSIGNATNPEAASP